MVSKKHTKTYLCAYFLWLPSHLEPFLVVIRRMPAYHVDYTTDVTVMHINEWRTYWLSSFKIINKPVQCLFVNHTERILFTRIKRRGFEVVPSGSGPSAASWSVSCSGFPRAAGKGSWWNEDLEAPAETTSSALDEWGKTVEESSLFVLFFLSISPWKTWKLSTRPWFDFYSKRKITTKK